MLSSDSPCLSLAIARLMAADPTHYALWVLQAPYPGGYGHHDRLWPDSLTQAWQAWQSMFSLRGLPEVPRVPSAYEPAAIPSLTLELDEPPASGPPTSYSSRLMQHLGVNLWQWVFEGPIQTSLSQSQGIAIGQGKSLRLRLEIRDPDLIALPWEIMQPQPGKQSVSLSQQLLFSRTTSDIDPLPPLRTEQALNILLVLGQDSSEAHRSGTSLLKLEEEARMLAQVLEQAADLDEFSRLMSPVTCQVTTLLQPTAAELSAQIESRQYNVFFYAGHGIPAPDGGLLFLRSDAVMNGTELAQLLTRQQVKLAVFNACWGAQPDQHNHQTIPRSSLAEVLIHHGVPAVLAMRDSISDDEALSFIQVLARALAERMPIDQAVAIARQHLLTIYKFNQPAWTLPVLYMHPQFNGELIKPLAEGVTAMPENSPSWLGRQTPHASLQSVSDPAKRWPIRGGLMRLGSREGNDLVLRDPGVSRRHAEIFYRDSSTVGGSQPAYFLKDFSRYGTLILSGDSWQKIHHQEVLLQPRTQLKFGSSQSETLEFVIDGPSTPGQS